MKHTAAEKITLEQQRRLEVKKISEKIEREKIEKEKWWEEQRKEEIKILKERFGYVAK